MKREVGPGLSFPIPFFPPSLISHAVSVDVEHHEGRRLCAELSSCVNREVGLGSPALPPVPHKP